MAHFSHALFHSDLPVDFGGPLGAPRMGCLRCNLNPKLAKADCDGRCLYIYIHIYIHMFFMYLCLFRFTFFYIYIYTIHIFIYISIYHYLSIYLSIHLSIYLSIHLSIYIYICIYVYVGVLCDIDMMYSFVIKHELLEKSTTKRRFSMGSSIFFGDFPLPYLIGGGYLTNWITYPKCLNQPKCI